MQANDEKQIRVLVVSSSHMMRTGMRMVLGLHSNIHLVGEVSAPRQAAEVTGQEQPDIVLIDLDLSGIDTLRLIQDVQKAAQNTSVLILSSLSDGDLTRQALCSGAAGVILKVQPPAVLIAAIESLCPSPASESPKTKPAPLTDGIHPLKTIDHEMPKISSLTTREREIIGLIGSGLKNKDIADRLCISETTVRHHLTNIFSKLEVSDRQQLLIWAHHYGLVELTRCAPAIYAAKER